MSRPSLIDLVNSALVTIGQEPIVSLTEVNSVSPVVTMVKNKVYVTLRKLLRSNDWNCARVTAQLSQKVLPVNDTGWDYVYELPTNPECLRVVQISIDGGKTYIDTDEYYNRNSGPRETLFDQEGTTLLCNSPTVHIKYTAEIDPAQFDAALASAFVAQLAADLAYSLPASVSLADYLFKLAKLEVKNAKSINARERNIHRPEGEVIGSRYGSGDRYLRVDMSDED